MSTAASRAARAAAVKVAVEAAYPEHSAVEEEIDEQLGENFPEFFYGKRLFHSTIFDVPPTPKPKLPSHESVAAARRGEHEFPNPQPAPDTVAAFSAYEALPYVKFQQRKPSTKSKPLTALKLKVKLPSRSSKPSDDAAAAAAAAAEDEMETEEDPDPTAAVVDERAASEIAEAAAAAATAAAEGAAKIAPERHYLVHQKSWEDQINWESNTKPNLPHLPWYSAQPARKAGAKVRGGGAVGGAAAGGGPAVETATAQSGATAGVAGGVGDAAAAAAVAAAGGGGAAASNPEFELVPEFLTPLVEVEEGKAISVFEPTNSKVMDGSWLDDVVWDDDSKSADSSKDGNAAVDGNDDDENGGAGGEGRGLVAPLVIDLNDQRMLYDSTVKKPTMVKMEISAKANKRMAKWKREEMIENARNKATNLQHEPLPAPGHAKDPFGSLLMSNDSNYRSKEGTANTDLTLKTSMNKQILSLKHAKPTVDLDDAIFPTKLDVKRLRNFHRPKLRGPAKIGTFKTLTTISEKSATSKKFKTGARWKQKDLTAQDGRVILAEYCEQHPPLLQQTGMSSLMRNFYRQDNTDKRAPAFEHGISSIVGFRDASPFLGDLKPGDHLQSLENNMFRAPVYRHKMSETDFLVIRKKETMTRADGGAAAKGGKAKTMTRISIRRIPIAYTVGQLCPKMEVPAPKSKLAQKHVSERLHVFICQTFKAEKLKYEQKLVAKPNVVPKLWGLTKEKCMTAFGSPPDPLKDLLPTISHAIVRNGLKKVATFKHQASGVKEGMWMWNEGEEMVDEQELHDTVTPEMICAYESMRAALLRLERMGYGVEAQDQGYSQEAGDHQDETEVTAQDEVRMAPWRVTSDFLAHIDGKCLMYVTGPADPTGCGEGFAYLRKPNKPANSAAESNNKLKPQESATIQGRRNTGYAQAVDAEGNKADLRKLTVVQMRAMLVQTYGMKPEDVKGLQRWRLVHLVRQHCTIAAGSEGNHRFARGQRSTIAEYQEQFRRDLQSRFDIQNANLKLEDKSTDESDSDDDDGNGPRVSSFVGDMNDSLKPGSRSSSVTGGAGAGGAAARKRSRQSIGTSAGGKGGLDDTSTVVSGTMTGVTENSKKIMIKRSYKDDNGKMFYRTQVVREPEVIEAYMRMHRKRETSGTNKAKQARYNREQKRKLKRELEALKKQALEQGGGGRASPSQTGKKGKKKDMRCGRCGKQGHIQTNRACPEHPGYNEGIGVPEEYAAIEKAKDELLSKNLTNVEGTRLKIDVASLDKFKQKERDQHRAFKSKQAVGYRNTGRANKRRRDGEDDGEMNWNMKKPSGHRARNKNPEVTLCTALDGCLREARVVDKELSWFSHPVPKSVAADYDTIVSQRMDLSIIQEKCRSNKYRSRHEFLEDFRQIAFNALLYNGQTHGIYEKAAELRDSAIDVVDRRSGELAPSEKALSTWLDPESEDKTPEEEKVAKRIARHKAANPGVAIPGDPANGAAAAAAAEGGAAPLGPAAAAAPQ